MEDKHKPGNKWEFDQSVTDVFEDMLQRSIPQYQVMRDACFDIGCSLRQEHTDIVDLGCSRGSAIDPFIRKYGATNMYVGVEVSKPMREVCKKRFEGWIDAGAFRLLDTDLREDYPHVNSSVTLCVLTLQFTPIEYRLNILDNIYQSLVPKGGLILVEKVVGSSPAIDRAMIDTYYKFKRDKDYSQEDIERKRLALEGVLVPVPSRWNEEMLSMTGFKQVDCFWRWMNFAAWVAIK